MADAILFDHFPKHIICDDISQCHITISHICNKTSHTI